MPNNRDEEVEKLNYLVANASAAVAAGLLSHLEELKAKNIDNLPLDEMIITLRDKVKFFEGEIARFPNLSRLFFEPFDVLFVDKYTHNPLPGSFKRDALGKIWEVIKNTIDPREFSEIDEKTKAALEIGNINPGRTYAAELRAKLAHKFANNNNFGFFNAADSQISLDDSSRFIKLLLTQQFAKDKGLSIDFDIENLSRAALDKYVSFLKELEGVNPELAAELIISIMANSSKPWMTLRILKLANSLNTDRKLDNSAYKIVGARLLAQIREIVNQFNDARSGGFDGTALAQEVEIYNKFSHGFEREDILSGDGPWQKELHAIRGRASQLLNDLCQRALANLERALPIDRTMIKGKGRLDIPRTAKEIDEHKFQMACDFARFIRDSRLYAPLGGFKVARDNALAAMLKHCDALRSGIFLQLKEDNKGKFFNEWVTATIEITRIVDDDAAAKSFERRILG